MNRLRLLVEPGFLIEIAVTSINTLYVEIVVRPYFNCLKVATIYYRPLFLDMRYNIDCIGFASGVC